MLANVWLTLWGRIVEAASFFRMTEYLAFSIAIQFVSGTVTKSPGVNRKVTSAPVREHAPCVLYLR